MNKSLHQLVGFLDVMSGGDVVKNKKRPEMGRTYGYSMV
jgi:hypothetical protein